MRGSTGYFRSAYKIFVPFLCVLSVTIVVQNMMSSHKKMQTVTWGVHLVDLRTPLETQLANRPNNSCSLRVLPVRSLENAEMNDTTAASKENKVSHACSQLLNQRGGRSIILADAVSDHSGEADVSGKDASWPNLVASAGLYVLVSCVHVRPEISSSYVSGAYP